MGRKVAFLIDGLNVHYALMETTGCHQYRWLAYRRLVRQCYMSERRGDRIVSITYFTAHNNFDHKNRKRTARHEKYEAALNSTGIEIILGGYRKKRIHCEDGKGSCVISQETRTDVNIAARLLDESHNQISDTVIIISGDNDLASVVEAFKSNASDKSIGVVRPVGKRGRKAKQLKKSADFSFMMKDWQLRFHQFPDIVQLSDGRSVSRPSEWK